MTNLITNFAPVDSLFDQLLRGNQSQRALRSESGEIQLRPRVNVFESDNEFLIEAELPGVTKDELKVEAENGTLTISAIRKSETKESHEALRVERYESSKYIRSFSLGDNVNPDGIRGALKEGVLTLTIPKVAKALPRQVPVD